jgi:hypothetical protein
LVGAPDFCPKNYNIWAMDLSRTKSRKITQIINSQIVQNFSWQTGFRML